MRTAGHDQHLAAFPTDAEIGLRRIRNKRDGSDKQRGGEGEVPIESHWRLHPLRLGSTILPFDFGLMSPTRESCFSSVSMPSKLDVANCAARLRRSHSPRVSMPYVRIGSKAPFGGSASRFRPPRQADISRPRPDFAFGPIPDLRCLRKIPPSFAPFRREEQGHDTIQKAKQRTDE